MAGINDCVTAAGTHGSMQCLLLLLLLKKHCLSGLTLLSLS
jgi:hypothetical protein